jgi:uncharacterized caspase-like protein
MGLPALQFCARWKAAFRLWALLSLALPALAQVGTAAEPRVALVIGNAAYRSSPLANPVNDARLMETALKSAGFLVMKAENASRRDMQRLIRDFGEKLKQSGGVGLFYFAGHGMQVRGNNYLIPTDADIRSEDEVAYDSIDAQSVLEKMESARNRVNLLILDACRDNPFVRGSRSAAVGLATMNAPSGSLIAYSTAPGSVASDGKGRNGLYTEQLAKVMHEPGLPVEDVFKQVRVAVRSATSNQQTPWENTALVGNFYFSSPQPAAGAAPAQAAAATDSTAADMAFWDSVKATSKPAELQAYLERFPNGVFAPLARSRLAEAARTAGAAPSGRPAAVPVSAPVVVAQAAPAQLPPTTGQPSDRSATQDVLVLRDKLTGKDQRIDAAAAPAQGGGVRYGTGDEIAADGQVRAVRIGTRVATVQDGVLWKLPLQVGSGGGATVRLEGVSRPVKLNWTVTGRQDNRASVEANFEFFNDQVQGATARRVGTWTAQYQDGISIPVQQVAEDRPTVAGGARDIFTGELKQAMSAAPPVTGSAAPVPPANSVQAAASRPAVAAVSSVTPVAAPPQTPPSPVASAPKQVQPAVVSPAAGTVSAQAAPPVDATASANQPAADSAKSAGKAPQGEAAPAAASAPAPSGKADAAPAGAGPNLTRIYFYRNPLAGYSGVQPDLKLNGQPVGQAPASGAYFFVDRPPGAYEVVLSQFVDHKAAFQLEAGKPAYVRISFKFMPFVGSYLAPDYVDAVNGAKEMSGLKVNGAR